MVFESCGQWFGYKVHRYKQKYKKNCKNLITNKVVSKNYIFYSLNQLTHDLIRNGTNIIKNIDRTKTFQRTIIPLAKNSFKTFWMEHVDLVVKVANTINNFEIIVKIQNSCWLYYEISRVTLLSLMILNVLRNI